MKGNIKKIIALFLIVILNAHNISFSLEENTQNKEIQNTIEEIKDSQESTEKKFAQIV